MELFEFFFEIIGDFVLGELLVPGICKVLLAVLRTLEFWRWWLVSFRSSAVA